MTKTKTCRKSIGIIFAVVLALFFAVSINNAAYAASSRSDYSIKLGSDTIISDELALKLDGYIRNGKTVDICVKGSKKASAKLIKSLQKKIQKTNKLGVIFTTQKAKKSGKSYIYKITNREVRLYKYSTQFINRMWKDAVKAAKIAQANGYVEPDTDDYNESLKNARFDFRFFYSFEYEDDDDNDWLFEYDEDGEDEDDEALAYEPGEKIMDDEAVSYIKMIDSIFSHSNFSELSDAQKIYIIDASMYFSDYMYRGYHDNSNKLFFMEYDKKASGKIMYNAYKKPDQVMKAINANKAKGVCRDFASAEMVLFSQLGMKSYYLSSRSEDHAWSVVKVTNSKGKKFYIPFDYEAEIYSKKMLKEDKEYIRDRWKYRIYKKDLWKQYKGRPSDVPAKINYTWDDII